jgi:hypothetical protein
MNMDPGDRKAKANQQPDWKQDLDDIQTEYSRLDATDPPDLLDQAVLNIARRELSAGRRRPLHWIGAFATASVIVLALTIVIQQDREPLELRRTNGSKQDAPASVKSRAEPVAEREAAETRVNGLEDSSALEGARQSDLMMKRSAETASDADLRSDDSLSDPESGEAFRNEFDELEMAPRDSARPIEENLAVEQTGRTVIASPTAAAKSVEEKDKSSQDLPEPEEWIQRLLLLKQSQLDEKLEEELTAFRKAYPNHPLPKELQD